MYGRRWVMMAGKVRSGYLGHINSNAVQPQQRCQLATFWPARVCSRRPPSDKLYANERVLYATYIQQPPGGHTHTPMPQATSGMVLLQRTSSTAAAAQYTKCLCTQTPHSAQPRMNTTATAAAKLPSPCTATACVQAAAAVQHPYLVHDINTSIDTI
jgi:hypothetical protein